MNAETWRMWFFVIFLTCSGLIGYALYIQYAEGLEPCPLCILQRIAFIVVGLLALTGGVHNPRDRGRLIYAGLIFISALFGTTVAVRHTWLQYNPDPLLGCGPDLAYTLENFPLSQAIPTIFQGSGSCSSIDWQFLGLSIPAWSLLFLSGLAISAIWIMIYSIRHR